MPLYNPPTALSAGTNSTYATTVSFSNANGISFGLDASAHMTASVAAGATATGNIGAIEAGTGTATSGTVNFANSNGVTFGMDASQNITASVKAGVRISYFEDYPAAGLQANSFSNAALSFGRIPVLASIDATQMVLLQHFTGSSSATGVGATITYSAGLYTMSGSSANLASSTTAVVSFNLSSNTDAASAYGGQSGTRYRTMNLGTWPITPGDYLFGIGMSLATTLTSLSISQWCRPEISINDIPGGGNASYGFLHGVYSATTGALPASVAIGDINYTGGSVQCVPWFALLGTLGTLPP